MNHSKNDRFTIEKVMSDAMEINQPIFAMIELTTWCNWKCEHCYIDNYTEKGLSFKEIKKLLYTLREIGVFQISFTGGEIFTRKDALEIIEYARKLKFRVNILSNASLITENIAKRLSELHIRDFSSTIFSLDYSIHDAITKTKGSLEKSMKGLELLEKYGINIELKSPILDKNKHEFISVYNYAKNKNYNFISSPCIFPKISGDSTPLEFSVKNYDLDEVVSKSDSIMNYEKKNKIPKLMCDILQTGFAISAKGEVFPCNSFFKSMGNIKYEHILDIWNKEEYKKIRNMSNEHLEHCFDCKLISFCDRCPATLHSEGKSYYGCSSIAKKIATSRLNNFNKKEVNKYEYRSIII